MLFGWGNRRAAAATADTRDARAQAENLGPNQSARNGEKRDLERVPLPDEVKGEVMVFQPMTILDLSVAGAQIETAFALQSDSLHDFRLTLGGRSLIVRGRIAHCHIGELTEVAALYRIGVEFISLSDQARHALEDFVHATKSSLDELGERQVEDAEGEETEASPPSP